MFYVVGDTHGDRDLWLNKIEPVLGKGDTVIVAGDFGFGFPGREHILEERFYDRLATRNYTVLFVDGNHENFDLLATYPVSEYCGGKVQVIRPNLLRLMRGEIYRPEDFSLFAFGGGYSLDKAMRTEGLSWWAGEMPSEEEYQNARENLKKAGGRVDFIVTHTAPSESVYYLSKAVDSSIHGFVDGELKLNAFLDGIAEDTGYKHWYFGHFHVDADLWRSQSALYRTVRELKTGIAAAKWVYP